MHLSTTQIANLLFEYRYVLLFPIAFVEGPVVAVVAGFMVSIKFMSFVPVYLILVFANIVGDVVFYSIGRFTPRKRLDKILQFLRISPRNVRKAEEFFFLNRKRAIVFGKLAHAVGSLFLITAGIVKVPFGEYLKLGTLIELPKALTFLLIGYYFGRSVANLDRVVEYSVAGFIVITIVFVLVNHYMDRYTNEQMKKQKKSK